MAKAILICGKICCGKSTYSRSIMEKENAVILSVDEIMLSVFGQDAGDRHDYYAAKVQKFLFDKSVEIIEKGVNVILDWGFWTAENRKNAKRFYTERNIKTEFHYIDISDSVWKQRIDKRNSTLSSENTDAYFVDEGLAEKSERIFEKPYEDEIDVWVKNQSVFLK